jgi:hypothetical protein
MKETKDSGNDDLDFSLLTFQPAASPLEVSEFSLLREHVNEVLYARSQTQY